MTEREIMELAKDIVMYFDGLEMCGETEDVLELMTEDTYRQIADGHGAEIIDELGNVAESICEEILEYQKAGEHYLVSKYWNSWQKELTVIHDLQERVSEAVYGNA